MLVQAIDISAISRPFWHCQGQGIRSSYCELCVLLARMQAAKEYNTHLQAGANIAGFLKVADAMLAHGVF